MARYCFVTQSDVPRTKESCQKQFTIMMMFYEYRHSHYSLLFFFISCCIILMWGKFVKKRKIGSNTTTQKKEVFGVIPHARSFWSKKRNESSHPYTFPPGLHEFLTTLCFVLFCVWRLKPFFMSVQLLFSGLKWLFETPCKWNYEFFSPFPVSVVCAIEIIEKIK